MTRVSQRDLWSFYSESFQTIKIPLIPWISQVAILTVLIRLKRIIHFPSTFPARRVGQLEVLHRVSERLKFRCHGQELNIYVNLMRTHEAIEMKHTSKYAREAEVGLV